MRLLVVKLIENSPKRGNSQMLRQSRAKYRCGIYKIINLKTGKFYLGSSVNIAKRFAQHLCDLRGNRHHSIYLQRAFNKHGEGCLKFQVVELCDKSFLKEREQAYLRSLDYCNSYNVSKTASGGDILSYHPNKKGIVSKIKATINKQLTQMSEQQRKERWGRKGKDNPNWRGGRQNLCPECKKPIVAYAKTCRSCMDRSGKNNSFYNRSHTQETKLKLSKLMLGKKPLNARPVIIDGKKYESLADAAKALRVVSATIFFRIKSSTKQFSGYFYAD